MLTALVLVRALATPMRDCDVDHAVDVLRVPGEFGHPAQCYLHGSAYYAELSLDVGAGNRVKAVCIRSTRHDNVG